MTSERMEKLVDGLMDDHWEMVNEKPYPKLAGVWDRRDFLPVAFTTDFKKTGELLKIPLVGDGYISFGITERKEPEIGIEMKYSTASGTIKETEFAIFEDKDLDYGFDIFFDDPKDEDQAERMKFLARLDPERDIDWERIKTNTDEQRVALALCRYKSKEDLP
jgi:hypothetical protein